MRSFNLIKQLMVFNLSMELTVTILRKPQNFNILENKDAGKKNATVLNWKKLLKRSVLHFLTLNSTTSDFSNQN